MSTVATERLARCEVTIQTGRKATLEMARALREIRDDKLYKPAGHDTFEGYCRHRWGWSRSRAYQIIDPFGVNSIGQAADRIASMLDREFSAIEPWQRETLKDQVREMIEAL